MLAMRLARIGDPFITSANVHWKVYYESGPILNWFAHNLASVAKKQVWGLGEWGNGTCPEIWIEGLLNRGIYHVEEKELKKLFLECSELSDIQNPNKIPPYLLPLDPKYGIGPHEINDDYWECLSSTANQVGRARRLFPWDSDIMVFIAAYSTVEYQSPFPMTWEESCALSKTWPYQRIKLPECYKKFRRKYDFDVD